MVMSSSRIHGPTRAAEPIGFAAMLRNATWSAHGKAETGGALSTLIRGHGDLLLYRTLLSQLYFVYAELESATEAMRVDPVVARFAAFELTRLPALQADLDTVAGPGWAATIAPLAETEHYLTRLRQVAKSSSGRFIAHHYTRYLGDLSGGFAIGSAVRRSLGLTGPDGRRFFIFEDIADPIAFKENYRRELDRAAWTNLERDEIAAETRHAYRLNTALQVAVERAAHRERATGQ
ncbi:biliverdin-producing heme oxygenase [Jatrophihabitans sp. DSM 45814]